MLPSTGSHSKVKSRLEGWSGRGCAAQHRKPKQGEEQTRGRVWEGMCHPAQEAKVR